MSLALWLIIYMLVAFLIGRAFTGALPWSTVRLFFYPGVVIDILGRSLACLFAGDGTEGDFSRDGGPGALRSVPGGPLFKSFYVLAPLVASIAVYIGWEWALGYPSGFEGRLPRFETEGKIKLSDFAYEFMSGYVGGVQRQIGQPRFWGYIYVSFALVIGCAPSLDDLKAGVVALLFVGVGLQIAGGMGIQQVVDIYDNAVFWRGFSSFIACSLFVLAVSGTVLLPVRFLRSKADRELST